MLTLKRVCPSTIHVSQIPPVSLLYIYINFPKFVYILIISFLFLLVKLTWFLFLTMQMNIFLNKVTISMLLNSQYFILLSFYLTTHSSTSHILIISFLLKHLFHNPYDIMLPQVYTVVEAPFKALKLLLSHLIIIYWRF